MQPIQKYIDQILAPDRPDLRAKLNPAQVKRLQEGTISWNAKISYVETCFPGIKVLVMVEEISEQPQGAKNR